MVVTTWTRWSSSSPDSCLDRRSCTIVKRTWPRIAHCCEFAGLADAGCVRMGNSPVEAYGSWITKMWPWSRACQKDVGR